MTQIQCSKTKSLILFSSKLQVFVDKALHDMMYSVVDLERGFAVFEHILKRMQHKFESFAALAHQKKLKLKLTLALFTTQK